MPRRSGLQVGEEGGVQGRGPGCSEGMRKEGALGRLLQVSMTRIQWERLPVASGTPRRMRGGREWILWAHKPD